MDIDFSTFTHLINHWINRKQNNQQVPAFQNNKTPFFKGKMEGTEIVRYK